MEKFPGTPKEEGERKPPSKTKMIARAVAFAGLGMISSAQESSAQELIRGDEGDRKGEVVKPMPVQRGEGVDMTHLLVKKTEEIHHAELLRSLNEVSLLVNNNGRIERHTLTPDELLGRDAIDVDGFVVRVFATAKDSINIDVDGEPFAKIEHQKRKDLKSPNDPIEYHSHFRSLNLPMSDHKSIKLHISKSDDLPYTLQVDQRIFEKIDELHLPYTTNEELVNNVDTTHVMYIGSRKESLHTIPELKEKLGSIAHAVVEDVENRFGVNIIDTLGVIESFETNAFVLLDEKQSTMFFFRDILEQLPPRELALVGRHEALHHFVDDYGYARSDTLFSIWNTAKLLHLSFINEKNFFESYGGHAEENVDELSASFFNSLISIEEIEQALTRSVITYTQRTEFDEHMRIKIVTDEQIIDLTPEDQGEIIDWYLSTTDALRSFAQKMVDEGHGAYSRDIEFFEEKIDYLNTMKGQYIRMAGNS